MIGIGSDNVPGWPRRSCWGVLRVSLRLALLLAVFTSTQATAAPQANLDVNEILPFFDKVFKEHSNLNDRNSDMKGPNNPIISKPADPDVGLDMVAIATARGYTIDTHYVTTADGYILTMFNIPYGKHNNTYTNNKRGPPVLLQHGLLDSSYTWVNNYDDESLGYILADAGFDVWFGNNRGNRYGRNHTTLDPNDPLSGFWEFTWDEMASQDLPAMVQFVLKQTGYPSLGWVGHSEGTIQMFAAGSIAKENAVVNDAVSKVNLFVALAPVAYVAHVLSPELLAIAKTNITKELIAKGHMEFLPYGPLNSAAATICRVGPSLCQAFIGTLCGPTNNLNATRMQVYVSQTPAGTSLPNMDHWQQGMTIDKFQRYDYGSADLNIAHYGPAYSSPPLYDLSTFQIPTALFSGGHDFMASPIDVRRLVSELPKRSIVVHNEQLDYAHLDFTWAVNANERIYGVVSELLAKHATSVNK